MTSVGLKSPTVCGKNRGLGGFHSKSIQKTLEFKGGKNKALDKKKKPPKERNPGSFVGLLRTAFKSFDNK